jgi:hypothetical protein
MKRISIFVFTLTAILYFSNRTALAQGKGFGLGPHVEQGRTGHIDTDRHADRDNDRAKQRPDHDANQEAKGEKFEERIERNPALSAKVASLLPRGTNLKTAASGFKNEGQFIAALHVSKNLNIPFNDLKAKMTGPNAMSLGQAIRALKPNMTKKDAEKEADKAEKQAKVTEKAKPTVT